MPRLRHISLALILYAGVSFAEVAQEVSVEDGGPAGDPQRLFVLANEDYRRAFDAMMQEEREKLLEKAVDSYRGVIDALPSATAYHNLGNALFRLGRLGESISAYRRSRLLASRNSDTTINLDYVRSKCRGTPEPPEPGALARALLFWYYGASLRGLEMAAVLLWLTAWGLVCMWIWLEGRRLLKAAVLCMALALLCGSACVARVAEWESPSVVVAGVECKALSEARPTATPLFTLGEGSEVGVGRIRAGWVEAQLPDGRRGWVASDDVLR